MISNGNAARIKCPDYNCKAEVLSQDIDKYVSANTFQKFKKFMGNYEVAQNPNLKHCPLPGCDGIIKCKPKTAKI